MGNQNRPHYFGHRKRLKEKFAATGLKGWLDHEILEFALSFAIPRKDTKPAAKLLLGRFKNFSSVLDADKKDLETVKGISEHSASLLKLFKDISVFYLNDGITGKNVISAPGLAVDYLKIALKGSSDEEFYALFLDSGNRLIASEKLHTGTVNKAAVYPRKVAERALYHKAAGVIISHNHPGGTLKPSEDDKHSTEAVKKALNAIESELLDHIIICGADYFSFKENQLL
jgi:DNA repair protein RadC